ncbi:MULTISPECIES: FAD:protein FMN transferase [Fusobacterium]|uniref:FAD:protein FMN transferase n=1 Tax=Fusobacterium TaxID=848 RepID=UPI0025BF2074|nr:FAD:protein FMN transferase [Fusobacterium sp.]MCI5724852.1 FAD:protein FMN transferase [Fusobacterium sp.]MDY5305383.1 FAD:protein FMN transferase [Fusobacterium gastrosuis]
MKRNKVTAVIIFMLLFLLGCSEKKMQKYEDSRFLFGTYIKIIIYDESLDKAKLASEKAFQEIERIDSKFNSKYEGSIIDKLNKSSKKEVDLDAEGTEIFNEVEKMYILSNKKYDITIGPLLKLWGFTDEMIDSLTLKVPKKEEIEFTKHFIGYDKVKRTNNKLIIESPVKEIDTGSFLKGYALSQAKKLLLKEGIKSAFITSISSIDLIGSKPLDKPWKIGLQNPENPSELLGIVALKNKALGVSGDYQTYVEIDGEMYHHIIDKESGYPIRDKKMVAVVCNDAFLADLYSTTFFLMPIDKVMEYVESQKDLEVMIVDKDMNIVTSKNFEIEEVKK